VERKTREALHPAISRGLSVQGSSKAHSRISEGTKPQGDVVAIGMGSRHEMRLATHSAARRQPQRNFEIGTCLGSPGMAEALNEHRTKYTQMLLRGPHCSTDEVSKKFLATWAGVSLDPGDPIKRITSECESNTSLSLHHFSIINFKP
jgi:hypothetical protein